MRQLRLGPVRVDLEARRVVRPDGDEHRLTPTEHALLVHLLSADGRVVPRAELLREVWGYRSQNTRTLATTVRRLRIKIEPDPDAASVLLTVPRVGYRLDIPSSTTASEAIVEIPPEREGVVDAAIAAIRRARWVTITGPAGSGKSTVAACVAHRVGAVWVDASADVLWSLSRAMGWALAEPTIDRVAALLNRTSTEDPTVLWLDDADDLDRTTLDTLLALHRACPAVAWACSRRRPFGDRASDVEQVVTVGPLSEAAAVALLDTPDYGLAIARAVDRLPLALELVKAWIPLIGAAAVLRQLETGDPLVGLQRPGPARHRDLEALVDSSLARLDPAPLETLRALSAFAGPTRLTDLQAMAPGCVATLPDLLGPGLVVREGPRFRVLSAVQRRLRRQEAMAPWIQRHRAHLARLGTREAVEAALAGQDDAPRVVQMRDELSVAFRAESVEAPHIALALATAAELDGGQALVIPTLLEARSSHPGDPTQQARLLVALARASRSVGRSRWALQQLDAAFAASSSEESSLDPVDIAEVGHARALLLRGLGDGEEALRELDRVLPTAPPGSSIEARIHGSLGLLTSVVGAVDRAEVHVGRALELHAARGDRRTLAAMLVRSAVLEQQAGRDWRPTLEHARELAETVGTTELLAHVAAGHAMLCAWSSDSATAVGHYAEAASAYRELGAEEQLSRMELSSAAVLLNLARDDEAKRLAGSALPLVRQRGDRQAEAQALFVLGVIEMRAERWAAALTCFEPALERAVSATIREQLEERIARCVAAVHGIETLPDA